MSKWDALITITGLVGGVVLVIFKHELIGSNCVALVMGFASQHVRTAVQARRSLPPVERETVP